MKVAVVFFVVAAVASSAFVPVVRQSSCDAAAAVCRFTFEGGASVFKVGTPDIAFTPKIILKGCTPQVEPTGFGTPTPTPTPVLLPSTSHEMDLFLSLPSGSSSPEVDMFLPLPSGSTSPETDLYDTPVPVPTVGPGGIPIPTSSPTPSVGAGGAVPAECTIGSVDNVLEAYVLSGGSFIPISQFSGPEQPFTPSFFKTASATGADGSYGSGVSHETPQTDQVNFLDGLCVVLPLGKWQQYGPGGQVLNLVNNGTFTDCVAFTATL